MTVNNPAGSTLILGVGNILLGDEGFGVHVIRRLKETALPPYVRLEEGGVGGFGLLGMLEGVSRLVVVDVMMLDKNPGELYMALPGVRLSEPGKNVVSFHQVGITDLVSMWGFLGKEPEIWYLVTRPIKLEWSMEPSSAVQTAIIRAASLLADMCRSNFEDVERSLKLCTL